MSETGTLTRDELELGQYIPLHYHFSMLADEARTGAFAEAIEAVVVPGMRVADLGCGTGVLAFFAARRGARVWAVERHPELVAAARSFLERNGADTVEVVQADAHHWLPPEPVDVVICEMLHVGLLREHQIQVLDAFARGHLERFGSIPRFLPEAIVQAVQPVEQDFGFSGYAAPVPVFQDGRCEQPRTTELGAPAAYQSLLYETHRTVDISWTGRVRIETAGHLNALRFITKNLLAISATRRTSIDWLMNYLVLPLAETVTVAAGDTVEISFAYEAGGPIASVDPRASVVAAAATG